MFQKLTIFLFALLLSGPGLEVKAAGSVYETERSEQVEVTVREACHPIQSIRLSGGSAVRKPLARVHQAKPSKVLSSQSLPLQRKLNIQIRQLLI
ncbi:MAG TPA: hypothetical protein PK325_14345 [Cyclobacteriaceae bacterium]|nr:hypothetical protein [Cyclobacteriaceae bacterium]HMV11057.1 hypothetical protein [Cyclobacteriaceae bacterium]HMV90309.1 hypothetical protein [Cyclobacteriaceae bacterium]HMX02722.1 hypothetical protein [Cyclobacteriaceae bacterium]HMX51802.1 hypothetical protein [Cyclobacteriaceae bacterium]